MIKPPDSDDDPFVKFVYAACTAAIAITVIVCIAAYEIAKLFAPGH